MGVEAEENGLGSVKVRALNVAANEEDNDRSRCSRRPAMVGASGTTLPLAINLRVWPSIEAGMLLLAVVEVSLVVSRLCLELAVLLLEVLFLELAVLFLELAVMVVELAPLLRSTTETLILSPWDNW